MHKQISIDQPDLQVKIQKKPNTSNEAASKFMNNVVVTESQYKNQNLSKILDSSLVNQGSSNINNVISNNVNMNCQRYFANNDANNADQSKQEPSQSCPPSHRSDISKELQINPVQANSIYKCRLRLQDLKAAEDTSGILNINELNALFRQQHQNKDITFSKKSFYNIDSEILPQNTAPERRRQSAILDSIELQDIFANVSRIVSCPRSPSTAGHAPPPPPAPKQIASLPR